MDDHVLSYNPNWLFVTFVSGSFGHQVSRCLCTSPDVVWYDFPYNGEHPWIWNHFTPVFGFGHSMNHFVPWFENGNRVSGFGFTQQWHVPATFEIFNQDWILKIQETQNLILNTHDTPAYIRKRFPNSKIVLIVVEPDDWFNVVRNHIDKSSNYPIIYNNGQEQNPDILDWHNKTSHIMWRDWEQYSNKLTNEEWIEWSVKKLKNTMETLLESKSDADAIFYSSGRSNADKLVDLHNTLKISHIKEDIQKVLDAYNLENSIKRYL
jgi:hypothetical protein